MTILKFELGLYHGSEKSYLLSASVYVRPNDARKIHYKGDKTKGEMAMNIQGTAAPTVDTVIKL